MSTYDPDDGFEDDEVDNLTPAQVADAAAKRRIAEKRAKGKEDKALRDELEELRAWKATGEAEKRNGELATTFEELGLSGKWTKHYPSDAPTDKASIEKWATDEDYLVPSLAEIEQEKETAKLVPFKPLSRSDSSEVRQTYTVAEIVASSLTPGEKQAAFEQGRVLDAEGKPLRR
jgi:hypothetical protein